MTNVSKVEHYMIIGSGVLHPNDMLPINLQLTLIHYGVVLYLLLVNICSFVQIHKTILCVYSYSQIFLTLIFGNPEVYLPFQNNIQMNNHFQLGNWLKTK